MSTSFVLSLIALVALVIGARLLLGGLPLSSLAKRLSVPDAVMTGVGLLGLAFHCGAMFFPGLVTAIPGAQAAADAINALGTASIVWYVVPALLVLAGLRRLHWSGPAAISLVLTAVGVTMYNGGPLEVHLATIFAAGVVLAMVAAVLVLPPSGRNRRPLSDRPR
ncbi:MAG: hypothetical protein AVDCRST_MAG72-893 [uncultured Nocardioidaceae bacterium]|uniref:Uncharacterized protein n=1 Tax=uncultured Nocardioidaceae bacterium TaxID=253824 RepID=A0A6J4LX27_9ACTN|nr:MAG: hypothetical protein AVDCRST_MAG72-893 [uncultured Nocardioidaceae bacterium]